MLRLNNFFFKELYEWIKGIRYFLLFGVLVPGIYICDKISLYNYTVEYKIQLYGLILQIVGTVIVLTSINQKMKLFKGIGFLKSVKAHFSKLPSPFRSKHRVMHLQGGSYSTNFASAELTARRLLKENTPDAIKIYIDHEISQLRHRIDEDKKEIARKVERLTNEVKSSNSSISLQVTQLESKVKNISVSEEGIDVFSVAIIVIGLIYSTASSVMYKWLW